MLLINYYKSTTIDDSISVENKTKNFAKVLLNTKKENQSIYKSQSR